MLRIAQNLLLLAVLAFPGLSEPPIVHAQSAFSGSISGQSQQTSVKSRVPTQTVIRYGAAFFADKSPKTALDMVNLLPGFTFSVGDTSIRGYAAAAGNVLIDGERPSEKQFTLDTVLQQIPANRVAYIEVITGPVPNFEMLGQPVVANVVRKKSTGTSTIVTLSDGFFLDGRNTPAGSVQSTRRASGGRTLSGAVSASQYVELAEGNGPQIRRDIAGNVLNTVSVGSAAGGLTAYAYGVFSTPAWNGLLSINASSARTDYAYREQDNTTFPTASSSNLHEYLGGPLGGQLLSELGVHFNRNFREKLESESVVLFDPSKQTYTSQVDSPGVVESFLERQRGGEALGRTNLRYTATPRLTAEGSVEVTYNWVSTASSYFYNSLPVPLPNALATVTEIRDQILGHITWSIHKSFTLDVGTQVEDSTIASKADLTQSKTLNYFKPRIAFNVSPNSKERFSLRVEHEVGQLNFADFVAVSSLDTGSILAGNTDIVPQQDWVFEAANENHFWSEGDLALTYRHYIIADTLDRVPIYSVSDPTSVFDAPGNIGSGVEDAAIVSITLPMDRFRIQHGQLKVTGTRIWSSVSDPTTGAIRPISGLNPFEYSVNFRQDLPRWRADWGASFLTPCFASSTVKGCTESQYRFDEIDSYRATPTMNVFAEYQPWKSTSLRIEADNVLQQRYNRVVNIYAGPRNANPLSYQDDRSLTSSASVVFSLRKTF
jgi:hypothetical protein